MTKPAEKKPSHPSGKTGAPSMLGGLALDSSPSSRATLQPEPEPAASLFAIQTATAAETAAEKVVPSKAKSKRSTAGHGAALEKASASGRKRRTIYFTEDVDKRLRLYVGYRADSTKNTRCFSGARFPLWL